MAINKSKLSLEKYAFQKFMKLFNEGKFRGQRLGQAFCNHFKLERLQDQNQLRGLYEKDGKTALLLIGDVFKFN